MIATATLLDKSKYLGWAQRAHRLSGSQSTCLHYLLINILGSRGQLPHNGWTSARHVARETGLAERTVQRAWDRLEELRLIRRTGAAQGRGGCTYFHVAGLAGAADRVKAMEAEAAAARRAALDAESTVENTTGRPYLRCRKHDKPVAENTTAVSYNPFLESPLIEEPLVGGRGEAAAGAAGAAEISTVGGNEEGPLTRPRADLLARLRGWTGKAGHELTNGFLEHVGAATVQRWLRLNSNPHRRDKLFAAAIPALADYLDMSPVELGAAIAAPATPEQPKAPAPSPLPPTADPPAAPTEGRPPAPPPVDPPPAASARPGALPPFPGRLRPTAAWQGHGRGFPVQAKREPRPPLQLTAEHLLASGARLGIPKRAAEGRR